MRYIKGTMLLEYELHLRNKERSSATIEKYKRDIKAFLNFLEKTGESIKKEKDNDKENLKNKKKRNFELMIKKDSVICYKEYIKK